MTSPERVLVAGLGSADRGDDGIGSAVAHQVARAVAELGLPGVEVLEHAEPMGLLEAMLDRDLLVVVDAVRSGAAPGTVTARRLGPQALEARMDPGSAGTHGLGLAMALGLARALDRLPETTVVVGVEAAGIDRGQPLSAAARAALPLAVGAVLECLDLDLGPHPAW